MPDSPNRTLALLARTLEELLHAGGDAAARLRERAETESASASAVTELLATWIDRLEGPALQRFRQALRNEMERWDARAAGDPAAARVRDLIAALYDVLVEDEDPVDDGTGHNRSANARRRSAAPRPARKRAPPGGV